MQRRQGRHTYLRCVLTSVQASYSLCLAAIANGEDQVKPHEIRYALCQDLHALAAWPSLSDVLASSTSISGADRLLPVCHVLGNEDIEQRDRKAVLKSAKVGEVAGDRKLPAR